MKDFNQFIQLFRQELNEFKNIQDHKELERFHSFLGSYIQVAEFTYPAELQELLMTANQCPIVIEQIETKVSPLKKEYQIDISPQGIKLTKGKKDQMFPLLDLRDFILTYFHDQEDLLFYLILAWLLKEDNFYNIQIFGVIMQIKSKTTE